MKELFKKFIKEEDGATMVEYAIMVALIAVVAVSAVILVGEEVETTFSGVDKCLSTPNATNCS